MRGQEQQECSSQGEQKLHMMVHERSMRIARTVQQQGTHFESMLTCAVSCSRCLRCMKTRSRSWPAWRFFSLMCTAICCTSSGSVAERIYSSSQWVRAVQGAWTVAGGVADLVQCKVVVRELALEVLLAL